MRREPYIHTRTTASNQWQRGSEYSFPYVSPLASCRSNYNLDFQSITIKLTIEKKAFNSHSQLTGGRREKLYTAVGPVDNKISSFEKDPIMRKDV